MFFSSRFHALSAIHSGDELGVLQKTHPVLRGKLLEITENSAARKELFSPNGRWKDDLMRDHHD
jgi:hypothetical protein